MHAIRIKLVFRNSTGHATPDFRVKINNISEAVIKLQEDDVEALKRIIEDFKKHGDLFWYGLFFDDEYHILLNIDLDNCINRDSYIVCVRRL